VSKKIGSERTAAVRAPYQTIGALLVIAVLAICILIGGCGLPAMFGRGDAERTERILEAVPLADAPMLRVGLAVEVQEARISGRGGFTVSLYADTTRTWQSGSGAIWTFRVDNEGFLGRGPGGEFLVRAGTVRISPGGLWPLILNDSAYRGEIELFLDSETSISVVNVVDIESYLRGVVPLEIGTRPRRDIEAVKAQAVVARTYAIACGGARADGDFDVFTTVEDQVYGGIDSEDPICNEAIDATRGVVVLHQGEPIKAYYSSCCGGRTSFRHEVWELPPLPYLESVWDTPGGASQFGAAYCRGASNFSWTESWSEQEINALVTEHLPELSSRPLSGPVGRVVDIRVTDRTRSGRSRWLTVETTTGTYRVYGDRARWLLRRPGGAILRSARFDLDATRRGGKLVKLAAEGRGNGHGVGMCQHGALGMAAKGRQYDEILRHYYRGVDVRRLYSPAG
jgi:stage II sporulation protein D